MEMDKMNFPEGWKVVTLKDVGEIVSGGTPSTKEPSFWDGDIAWISPADLSGYTKKYITRGRKSITEAGLKNSSARLMKKGAVLFSSRAPIGYVVISANEVCTNQGFKSIVPNESVTSDYLYHYLKASKAKAEDAASGTTFKEISLKSFSALPIPLPPLAEQERIVAEIETLFSELDAGKAALQKAVQQLKTYRQAVLKFAFEGRLTNEAVVDGALLEGWEKTTLGTILKVSSGKGIRVNDLLGGDYPVYGGNGINGYHSEYFIENPTLIIGRVGAKCGVTHITESKSWVTDNALIVQPITNDFNIRFFKLKLEFEDLNKLSVSTAQPVISGSKIYSYYVNVPPIDEQYRIVEEIEARLSVCDKMEETIAQSLQQAEALRQSILKKAFEGRLVEQDSDDEPIQFALERAQKRRSEMLNRKKEQKMKTNKTSSHTQTLSATKSILELLRDNGQAMSAKVLWQISEYKDDIDRFYAELKRLVDNKQIKEARKGKDSFLSISDKL